MKQNLKERFKKSSEYSDNGITLIALVITIIILLILARNINFDINRK
jgi:type II secretory pathway pseudopilin PulG